MKQPYIHTKCLNPQRVHNRYTGETIIVPCGHCEYCALKKGMHYSMLCNLESQCHTYTMFGTLTYANYALPIMKVCYTNRHMDEDGNVFDDRTEPLLVDCTRGLETTHGGEVLGVCYTSPLHIPSISKKVNLPDKYLPHLCKYDVQLFMKRLRKRISKYSNEKIRYFLCGEYGPVHFRPHYHFLLWFSDPKIYENLRQDLLKSWQFGRVDLQKSTGKAANYVAKYLNSYCNLPRVFCEKQTKPFVLHSNYLGEMVFRQSKKEVYEMSARDFVCRCLPINGINTDVSLWRSLKTYYFPKCKGFSVLNDLERSYAYTTYAKVRDWSKKVRVSEQAHYVLQTIIGVTRRFGIQHIYSEPLHVDYDINHLLYYFIKSCDINPHDYDKYQEYYTRIYSELRLSRHFLSFVCDGDDSNVNVTKMVNRIKQFWRDCDQMNLVKQYSDIVDFQNLWDLDSEDFNLFFWNKDYDIDYLKSTPYFLAFQQAAKSNIRNNMKHKKLNDLNREYSDM